MKHDVSEIVKMDRSSRRDELSKEERERGQVRWKLKRRIYYSRSSGSRAALASLLYEFFYSNVCETEWHTDGGIRFCK
jgi:hypothetical protein